MPAGNIPGDEVNVEEGNNNIHAEENNGPVNGHPNGLNHDNLDIDIDNVEDDHINFNLGIPLNEVLDNFDNDVEMLDILDNMDGIIDNMDAGGVAHIRPIGIHPVRPARPIPAHHAREEHLGRDGFLNPPMWEELNRGIQDAPPRAGNAHGNLIDIRPVRQGAVELPFILRRLEAELRREAEFEDVEFQVYLHVFLQEFSQLRCLRARFWRYRLNRNQLLCGSCLYESDMDNYTESISHTLQRDFRVAGPLCSRCGQSPFVLKNAEDCRFCMHAYFEGLTRHLVHTGGIAPVTEQIVLP